MSDQKKWFKVWTAILSDPNFSLMPLEDWGRWLKISALVAFHGTDGSVTVPLEFYENSLKISVTAPLHLPNIRVKNGNGEVTVTLLNWEKYQARADSYDRVQRYRERKKTSEGVTVTETLQETGVTTDKNRIDKNRIEEKREEKKKINTFVPPTIEEVTAYCQERKNNVDPEKWMAYYQSNGWRVGKNPMKDWHAAIRTWEKNSGGYGNGSDRTNSKENSARCTKYDGIGETVETG